MPASTAPVPDLYKYQIGSESTWGTAVDPSAQLGLVDDLQFTPEIEAQNLPDRRASLAPGYVAALLGSTGTAKMTGIATYEDLPYFNDAMFGIATPSGSNPYVRDYIGALGTIPTRRVFTLVKGQSTPVSHIYGLTGATLTEATFSVESKQPLKYDFSFIGKNFATDTFASLNDRTQTPILAPQFALYIDAVGGTIGTTAITTSWFKAEWKITSNAAVHYGIGSLSPVAFHESKWDVTLKLTLEVDATSKAILDSVIGSSLLQKQVRIKATTGASAIAQWDIAGSFLKSPEITTDTDGVSTFDFEMTGLYNSTLGNYIKASNTNTVASLA